MIKIENVEIFGWEHAIRGMRNPLNSWDRSDSHWYYILPDNKEECILVNVCDDSEFWIGPNDSKLMKSLSKAGTDHRKFMRMIAVYVDITAPLYWWKEFDTYKVGTVANSCSTMHKIHAKEFTLEDFSTEHLLGDEPSGFDYNVAVRDPENANNLTFGECFFTPMGILNTTIDVLNVMRHRYLVTKSKPMKNEQARKELMKKYWWQMIQLLPSSYNQKRTVMLNYEVLANIYKSRKDHRLDEWHDFCEWIKTLPYSELITGEEK